MRLLLQWTIPLLLNSLKTLFPCYEIYGFKKLSRLQRICRYGPMANYSGGL
jgi:hypothetical protein